MAIMATCTFCERTITLGIENQWYDSNDNYRCGEGSHIGWHHTPKGSTIGRDSAPFPETSAARNLLSPTQEDNPRPIRKMTLDAIKRRFDRGSWDSADLRWLYGKVEILPQLLAAAELVIAAYYDESAGALTIQRAEEAVAKMEAAIREAKKV